MNFGPSFIRKVVYIALIAVLLYPLFVLGQPASVTRGPTGEVQRNQGGTLAQLRDKEGISQANLGEIDPTGEAMRLATLGLRGVATCILWNRAHHYKTVEDYDKLAATVKQITNLQPNFISVWEFQAHNLSYNVSVEFDNYQHRYHWVKKGIDFLIEGTESNEREPRLLQKVGWFTGQKIGRADEQTLYRSMFRDDRDFHEELDQHVNLVNNTEIRGPDGKPDNWLVGRLWYQRAEVLVEFEGVTLRRVSPLIFHKDSPMSLINHAQAIEEEGYFRDYARDSWRNSGLAWQGLGRKPIPTASGFNIRLADKEESQRKIVEMIKELDELTPGMRKKLVQERFETLTSREKLAYGVSPMQWTEPLFNELETANRKMYLAHDEVAETAKGDVALRKARRLASDLNREEAYVAKIAQYRNIVAYEYWATRCEVEQTEDMAHARELVYQGKQFYENAKLNEARRDYEKSWDLWANILAENPALRDDVTADELKDHLANYEAVLRQLDEQLPQDFKLRWLMESEEYPDAPGGAGFGRGLPLSPRITPRGTPPAEEPLKPTTGAAPESPGEPAATDDSAPKPAAEPKPAPAEEPPAKAAADKDESAPKPEPSPGD